MAVVWTLKAFLPSMILNNHGHIVTIGSILGVEGSVDYCTSNAAALSIHDAVSCELIIQNAHGVHSTLVQLGATNTNRRNVKLSEGMDVQYVSDKIINAIQTNQENLTIPSYMNWILFCKSWMPPAASSLLQSHMGIVPVTRTA
ncbi:epidermal retinol dehydrogenase 2-like [Ptychodera flava]|uniref:epidermal retinol dehydrogenase 2-like n=1 Tax=Ptychodera flava TaxID=63121 RepID=UPI00396A0AD9